MVSSECHFGVDRTLPGVSLTNTLLLDPEVNDTMHFPQSNQSPHYTARIAIPLTKSFFGEF
jgi:hypothetical protein